MGDTIGPDVKTQVIVEYDCGISKIVSILVSAMHQCDIDLLRTFIVRCIVDNEIGFEKQIIDKIRNDNTEITVNPCGTWNIGGPISDCGVTGRKIVVDQYGGYCSVGGGAFSGKDMTKVDRSASYMARYIAKNIVASGLCNNAKVELSYMIGIPKPSSINIEMDVNQHLTKRIIEYIDKNIDCTPSGIMKKFRCEVPRNQYLAKYGHFGDDSYDSFHYPWEVIDFASDLFNYVNTD
jgi:S-adenosylmethionine synthetase